MNIHETCGRCSSSSLLKIPLTPGDHSRIVIGDRVLQTVVVDKYVCTDCGRVEEWVNNRDDLRRLKSLCARSPNGSPA